MKDHTSSLSIILPCYNEQENIENTIEDVVQFFAEDQIDGEVIVVDDGSTDASLKLTRKMMETYPNVRSVTLGKNCGYGAAVRAGLDAASKDIMGFMDSDRQFHASDFRRLLKEYCRETPFVSGFREQRADSLGRKIYAKCYGMLVRVVLRIHSPDLNCAMKLWKRELWADIRPTIGCGALFNAELHYRLRKCGVEPIFVSVPHYPRIAGTATGGNPLVVLRMFWELLLLRFQIMKKRSSTTKETAYAVRNT